MPRTFIGRTFGNNTGGAATCPAVAAPTLAVADNGDGTGGVATITASTAGAANLLRTARFTGATGAMDWINVGTITGNGTVTIDSPADLAVGSYLWQVFSSIDESANVSKIMFQPLTDLLTSPAVSSLYYRILVAVQGVVSSLGLAEGPQVVTRRFPTTAEGELPAVWVCPTGEELGDETTENEVLTRYPVLIVMSRGSDRATSAGMGVVMRWREQIRRALHKTTRIVDEIRDVEPIDPAPVFDYPTWLANRDVTALEVTYIAGEPRSV